MAKVLDSVTLVAPSGDPNINEAQTFVMTGSWTATGHGGSNVDLFYQYKIGAGGSWGNIPSSDGLSVPDNTEEAASDATEYNRTITGNTAATYYVRMRAYDNDNTIEKFSPEEQIVTVNAAAGWTNNLNGVANANIAKVNGIAIANIAKVNGV